MKLCITVTRFELQMKAGANNVCALLLFLFAQLLCAKGSHIPHRVRTLKNTANFYIFVIIALVILVVFSFGCSHVIVGELIVLA